MPFRIDMRNDNRNVRAMVRQPDGTYKQACVSVPDSAMRPAGASR